MQENSFPVVFHREHLQMAWSRKVLSQVNQFITAWAISRNKVAEHTNNTHTWEPEIIQLLKGEIEQPKCNLLGT